MDGKILIALISPILITIGGVISWFLKAKREEFLSIEEKARENKIKIYETLLEPFIYALTGTLDEDEKNNGIQKMLTLEYKKAAFNLITFGSDEVVNSYNTIMQSFFNKESYDDNEYGIILLAQLSELLLNIRKDLYSKNTKLKRSNLLEFMMTDIENYRDKIDNFKFRKIN
ncbi:hypothetical protein [Chryseobacterium sp. ERMR1:04]|uniref:hypothetical protein n=1 Tax=Chryseobacterium sp. ERMR1:04 TaxID=1705393 RepID=UPI0006C83614|nr:hypothetical protein [Chryseobacterium sp. ERMR1:04]KPH10864.1 hypothetical protein AMQ68_23680 [Chryseobacterium sp. ERMR1:04]